MQINSTFLVRAARYYVNDPEVPLHICTLTLGARTRKIIHAILVWYSVGFFAVLVFLTLKRLTLFTTARR
jgi:hypothetical protein